MRLRFIDMKCQKCSHVDEYAVYDDDPFPKHCKKPMEKVWLGSPTIDYKRQYSHALGRKVNTTKELDKALAKTGQWIASKAEANASYGTDVFTDNVAIRQNTEERTRKHVEEAAQRMVRDGVARVGSKGRWEWTGPE